jgi:MFS transporter, DHA1 family, multidrug resistance protein
MYSASALAANTIVRSAIGAAFPLFTVQMFTKVRWQKALSYDVCSLYLPF